LVFEFKLFLVSELTVTKICLFVYLLLEQNLSFEIVQCQFDLMIHHFLSQDTEVYKTTVKDDITKWQNVLKAHNSVDWLIVVVESDAKKKNKTNILPRTSIVDKIRNDFCNKQSDR